jgi:phosphatidylglycerophosphate synthase
MREKTRELFKKSLKPIETEEPLDLIFFRPLGFLFALLLRRAPVSPNFITILSMITGLTAAWFFSKGTHPAFITAACLLIVSHLFDCVDGQLARLRGVSSRLGKTLDILADLVTDIAAFIGVALAMIKTTVQPAWLWWLLAAGTLLFCMIHISLFDHFKNELIFYAIPHYHEKLESVKHLKEQRRALGRNVFARFHKFMLTIYIIIYIVEERLIKMAQPKGYGGYLSWYQSDSRVPQDVKNRFQTHYRRYNRFLVIGWSLLGAIGHVSVFIVSAFLNRLDLAFWIIIIAFNLWMGLLILLQHISLQHQLKKAYYAAENP